MRRARPMSGGIALGSLIPPNTVHGMDEVHPWQVVLGLVCLVAVTGGVTGLLLLIWVATRQR
jgi:hypothetical protein